MHIESVHLMVKRARYLRFPTCETLVIRRISTSASHGMYAYCTDKEKGVLKNDDLDPELLKNYRPVRNLSFLSKVLERVVAARLTNYMTINQLHEPMQSTYRACHSTETSLVRVQNDIPRTLDQGGTEKEFH